MKQGRDARFLANPDPASNCITRLTWEFFAVRFNPFAKIPLPVLLSNLAGSGRKLAANRF
jgi:hypothetical protein